MLMLEQINEMAQSWRGKNSEPNCVVIWPIETLDA